jgi:hypothetical protein
VVKIPHKGKMLLAKDISQIQNLSNAEYAASTAAKRKASKAGKQVSKQPRKIAKKTSRFT